MVLAWVVKVKQQKSACTCGGCIETALGLERATPGGRYSLDFAVKVAIDEYLDHISLSRQERILRRHGLVVTSQTLWTEIAAVFYTLLETAKPCGVDPARHLREAAPTRAAKSSSLLFHVRSWPSKAA